MSKYNTILFQIDKSIAQIILNRPEKMNALNFETLNELESVIDDIYTNSTIKAVIITGSGNKAFVAGADISELSKLTMSEAKELSKKGQNVFLKIEKCPKPVLASVNGFALGGGCELAMSCHFRIASENAKFGQPEVNLGLIPGYGGTQRLPRLVGKGVGLELLLTGDLISAQRALELGLVNKVVEQQNLIDECVRFLEKIISKAPIAVQYCIEAVYEGLNTTLEKGLDIEAKYFAKTFTTKDMKEGTMAFMEKRKAHFQGK